jgi:hypothetical protein
MADSYEPENLADLRLPTAGESDQTGADRVDAFKRECCDLVGWHWCTDPFTIARNKNSKPMRNRSEMSSKDVASLSTESRDLSDIDENMFGFSGQRIKC